MSDSEKKTGKTKIIPIIIGASSVCIVAVLVILFVVLGGKDKSGDIEQAEEIETSAPVSSEEEAPTETSRSRPRRTCRDKKWPPRGEAILNKMTVLSEVA